MGRLRLCEAQPPWRAVIVGGQAVSHVLKSEGSSEYNDAGGVVVVKVRGK